MAAALAPLHRPDLRLSRGATTESATRRAAYDAQLAAGLSTSPLAHALLGDGSLPVAVDRCAAYLQHLQRSTWFASAFAGHAAPLIVRPGTGVSSADRDRRLVVVGSLDRESVAACEQACLHELAHIVTADRTAGGEPREPDGPTGSAGHHHAWRVNLVLLVRRVIGDRDARRLRREFLEWGLPTSR